MEAKGKSDFLRKDIRRFLVTAVPIVEKNCSVKDVLLVLRKQGKELKVIHDIYVVDENQKLVGLLTVKDLFDYPESTGIEKIMHTKIVAASLKTDPEKIAHLALKHDITSVPIVEYGKLIGIIPPKTIEAILNQALRKDLFHFAGIHKSHLEYENSLTVPLLESLKHRVPWLIIGLIGAMLVAAFISVFEKTLEQYIVLVFFMPAVVYLSDALGTQLQTLFIRDLAMMGEELKTRRYILKQMLIALLIAFIISALMFAAISVFWGQPHLALVIAIATITSLFLSSFTALLITTLLQKLGYDPAMGGGPFATIVSDATSIIVYFVTVTLLL